jgi:hypothetical protein
MNENVKDQDVLLVKEKNSNAVKAVKGINDKNKKLETVAPKHDNQADFMKIDKGSNILDNFFTNFNRQVKNPTEFSFFTVPFAMLEKVINNFELLLTFKTEAPKPQKEPAINPDLVDWKKFEDIGISRKFLEYKGNSDKMSNLEKLLDYQKTDLLPVSVKIDGQAHPTSARLALQKRDDGTFAPKLFLIKHKPDLDNPYFGVSFTKEDKENLLATGNLGRIVEAEYKPGVKTPVLISLDRQTNHFAAFRVENLKVPDTYKGVVLSEDEKQRLGKGEEVIIKDMTSQKGKLFTRGVQFNADKKIFELVFRNDEKQGQSQNQQQNDVQKEVPKTFRKVELTEEQRKKLDDGITIYTTGFIDKEGKPYSGYLTFNKENGQIDFMFSKQYKEAVAAGKVIPDNAHKTQVDVNSNGKTNEATKNAKEPLDKGQTQPKEHQAEDKKKPKGMKMK